MLLNLSPELITTYEIELAKSASAATLKRKKASLTKFFDWAAKEGHLAINPLVKAPQPTRIPQAQPVKKAISGFAGKNLLKIGLVAGLAGLTFLLVAKVKLPIHFFPAPAQEVNIGQTTVPSVQQSPEPVANIQTPTLLSPWTIYAKFNFKSISGQALSAQTATFKLYAQENETTPLWTSAPKTLTPDINGDILISLANVPTELFLENEKLFLGTNLTSEKIPISTANTAANIGGFYPASPQQGAGPLTIPIISADGALILASESPAIKAKEGNLLIEGQVLTLTTPLSSDGKITLAPGGSGLTEILSNLKIQDANLTSGALLAGYVGNNTSNYDLINLSSGASASEKFSVDALGNTYAAGTLSTAGNLTTKIISATGYSQTNGIFSVIQKGTALSDLVTVTLDERNKPYDRNSIYSALVLKRYDGAVEGAALYVDEGNAIFDGQLRLGRYNTNPTAIGTGSIIYNSGDNKIYYWDNSVWQELVSVTSNIWTRASGVLYPTTTTDDLAVGGTDSSAPFFVNDSGNTITGDLAVNGDDITADGTALTINVNAASAGQLTLADTDTLNAGGITGVAYNAFADSADTPTATANITADNDLFIGGDLELKAGLYLTGRNIYNVIGGVGTEAITLATTPTGPGVAGDYNILSYGSWLVQNNTNDGMAALMVDQTKGGDIFTASASSATKFTITNAGDVGIGTTPITNKLEVEGNASKTIAGDWLANSDIRIKTDVQTIENALEVINQLRPVKFKYTEEYMAAHPEIKNQYYYNFIAQEFQGVFPDAVQNSGDGYLQLDAYVVKPYLVAAVQELNNRVKELEMRIEGTIDRLLVTSRLVSPIVQTKLISPLPDESDVNIQIGQVKEDGTSGFGELIIKDATGSAVASIDTAGNASFSGNVEIAENATISGELYADNIKSKSLDEIQELLHKVEADQSLLSQAANWNTNTASGSAAIANGQWLMANIQNLFVTDQAAIYSLSVSTSITVGSDLVFSLNSINTLTSPLSLQSLALAPVEIMAGKFRIETNGDVKIQGNVAIAGNFEVTGSTKLKDLSTEKIIIASKGNTATPSGQISSTEIQTNATAGKATLPGGSTELTINSPHVGASSLIYVTPTSETKNNVLYVKSKENGKFVVGFTDPVDIEVNFNWWIIETQ